MKIKDLSLIAIMAAVICICSWICIPMAVPFTMQTFGVFTALLILGGRRGIAAISLYILMGIVGLPVFSGLQGGVGHILGPTGGYIIGFLFIGIVYMLGENATGERGKVILLLIGLLICYLLGNLWFMIVSGNGQSFWAVTTVCVLPYIIPDVLKLLLARYISKRVAKHIPG